MTDYLRKYKGSTSEFMRYVWSFMMQICLEDTFDNVRLFAEFKAWHDEKSKELGFTTNQLPFTDNGNPTTSATEEQGKKELTFDDLFSSVEDKEMVMKMLVGLKIINSEGKYLLGNRTGMIRVFIDVMKEEGYFVNVDRKPILRVFTPVILGKAIEVIKEPLDFNSKKNQILKKLIELKK